MADSILSSLTNSKLCTLVLDALNKVYSYAGTIYDNPPEDMEGIEGEELWEEAWWRAKICDGDHDIETAFQKHLFDGMSEPQRVTPTEVSDAFWALATPLHYRSPDYDREYAEGVYAAFLNLVANQILSYRDSSPFLVGRVCKTDESCWIEMPNWVIRLPQGEPDVDSIRTEQTNTVWQANGTELQLAGNSPCTDMIPFWNNRFEYLNMRIAGSMSEHACRDLTDDLARTVPSIIRSLTSIQQPPTFCSDNLLVPCDQSLPVVTEGTIRKHTGFLRRCLDAYFSKTTKKDSLDRRIQNAVSLLVESDTQSKDGVALALSVASIEALLGEKGESVAERLSGNLAVLLEPDPERRGKAKKFFKDLYGLRSDALHGRRIDDIGGYRHSARCVAAAVLHSVIAREDLLRRSGFEPERPDQLLRELEKLHFLPGQPGGVLPLPVAALWRKRHVTER